MATKEKEKLINRLRHKYRLIIYNDNTYEEVWYIKLSRLNMLALIGTIAILIIGIVFSVIAYTPVREFIPGYPDGNMRRNIVMNAIKVDSLEKELKIRDQYFRDINILVSGKAPDDSVQVESNQPERVKEITFKKSKQDSLLRARIESEEQYNLTVNDVQGSRDKQLSLHFFTPLRGIVTNAFNPGGGHYGVDVVAAPNAVVKSVMTGTVIMAEWTLETGYVIEVQHDNNYVSVYKHNAELLKSTGDQVKAGEAIAIVGNSGEFTTGPHLHFELWHNGTPINPENYIVF